MTARTLEALWDEVRHLAGDADPLVADLSDQLDGLVRDDHGITRVVLVGSGDSLFAAETAAYAFRSPCEAVVRSTQLLADNPVPAGRDRVLVVGISASGGNASLADALGRARREGHATLALVGRVDSPVSAAADEMLLARLPERPPAPGTRSYQASLVALFLLAGRLSGPPVGASVVGLGPAVSDTVQRQAEPCRRLAERLAATPVVQILGSGPSFGAARYAAAKLVEAAGVTALGQDLEEWWHVERFATDRSAPLVVLAPAGRSHERAVRLCREAAARGHWIAALADPVDDEIAVHADLIVPLEPHEDVDPMLLEHLLASPLAAEVARLLGRHPFHRR